MAAMMTTTAIAPKILISFLIKLFFLCFIKQQAQATPINAVKAISGIVINPSHSICLEVQEIPSVQGVMLSGIIP